MWQSQRHVLVTDSFLVVIVKVSLQIHFFLFLLVGNTPLHLAVMMGHKGELSSDTFAHTCFIFVSRTLRGFPKQSPPCVFCFCLFMCGLVSFLDFVVHICLAKHHQTFLTDHHTNPRRRDAHAWIRRLCLWIFACWKSELSKKTISFHGYILSFIEYGTLEHA